MPTSNRIWLSLAVVDDIQHLVGEAEHLVCIAKYQLAKLGGLKASALSDQQLAAKTLLKQLDLDRSRSVGSKRASAACVTEPFF